MAARVIPVELRHTQGGPNQRQTLTAMAVWMIPVELCHTHGGPYQHQTAVAVWVIPVELFHAIQNIRRSHSDCNGSLNDSCGTVPCNTIHETVPVTLRWQPG